MRTQSLLFVAALILAACGSSAQIGPTLPALEVATQTPTTQVQPTQPAPTAAIQPTDASSTEARTAVVELTAQPTAAAPTESAAPALSGDFVKGEVGVAGSFTLDPGTNVLRLSDDFRIVPGPDLYVILSSAEDVTLDYQSFSQVVSSGTILYLGPLASTAGAQDYAIPAGTDLSQFKTAVIWCKSFGVEFAAARLRP